MQTDQNKLPSLLRRYKQLLRESLEVKNALAEVEREILSVGAPRRRTVRRHGISRSIKATLDVLRAAGHPLSRQEVASALEVSVSLVSVRLSTMVGMQLAERTGRGQYQAVEVGRRTHTGTPLAQDPRP